MSVSAPAAIRFFGLDVHKYYLIAFAVDASLNVVYGPRRVQLSNLAHWIETTLTAQDAVALEMTTNAFQIHDELLPVVHSVTVVHPPHVQLITRARVMTDRIAARNLATLLAKGLLTGIWVPTPRVRQQRALVAQRAKMVRLATQAKNRLHAVLHRYHIVPPPGVTLFAAQDPAWWLSLDLPPLQLALIQSDLDTLAFARQQISALEETLKSLAADDERVPFLIQIPGVGFVTAVTLLAAIGDISRFPDAKHLVGYAGLGARVHASGLSRRTGRITKAGRRDIRSAMVEAAQSAVRVDPHWRQELQRLEPRLGRNKAIVAIARKLLTTVWHVLSKRCADRFAHPPLVARKLLAFADTIGRHGRPEGWSRAQFVRHHLDQLRLGVDLSAIRRGKRSIQLPPSSLAVT